MSYMTTYDLYRVPLCKIYHSYTRIRYMIHTISCFVFGISFIIHPTLYIADRDTAVSERTIYELEQLSFNYDTNITPFWDS